MTIPVICEECGKIYHIPKAKLRRLKTDEARTKCKQCGFIITLRKADADRPDILREIEELDDLDDLGAAAPAPGPLSAPEPPEEAVTVRVSGKKRKSKGKKARTGGLGLRTKMIALFLVVPLAIMAASGYFTQRQTSIMVSDMVDQSAQVVTRISESRVADLSKAVSTQVRLYLESNPGLGKEDFRYDRIMRELAIQKVGTAGYTVLYSTGPFTMQVHPNDALIGKPLIPIMKKALRGEWRRLGRIIAPLETGSNVPRRGYYLWQDEDGTKKEKFMVMTPIEGTDFGIAATAYIREFTAPLNQMQSYASLEAARNRDTNLWIVVATLIIVGLIVTLYGHSLVGRISKLTEVADRISVGELDVEIQVTSRDELGSLADAVARMQDSLRISIMRLRKKP